MIVAGDDKQLPPTNFFEQVATFEAGGGCGTAEAEEFESILHECLSLNMPQISLQWHYRSDSELLIAFSNAHLYNSSLLTFPSSEWHSDAHSRKVGAPSVGPHTRAE